MKVYVICTGVVWLASPAAIALTNITICNLTASARLYIKHMCKKVIVEPHYE